MISQFQNYSMILDKKNVISLNLNIYTNIDKKRGNKIASSDPNRWTTLATVNKTFVSWKRERFDFNVLNTIFQLILFIQK